VTVVDVLTVEELGQPTFCQRLDRLGFGPWFVLVDLLLAIVLFGGLVLFTIATGGETTITWGGKWQEFVGGEKDGLIAFWQLISGLMR
jgi:hypothetical protein